MGVNLYMDRFNPGTWTLQYVKNNESDCSNVLLSTLNVAKDFLSERNYNSAANAFTNVIIGLEMLSQFWPEHYLPPLYANYFALGKVLAFGLHQADYAKVAFQNACDFAKKLGTEKARRDLQVMTEILNDFKRGRSLSAIEAEFGSSFPFDILNE